MSQNGDIKVCDKVEATEENQALSTLKNEVSRIRS